MEQYKNCYLKLKLSAKNTELFDDNKKLVIIKQSSITAVLHADQANDIKKVERIKLKMFEDFLKANQIKISSDNMNKSVKFSNLIIIPKKSEPITYKI